MRERSCECLNQSRNLYGQQNVLRDNFASTFFIHLITHVGGTLPTTIPHFALFLQYRVGTPVRTFLFCGWNVDLYKPINTVALIVQARSYSCFLSDGIDDQVHFNNIQSRTQLILRIFNRLWYQLLLITLIRSENKIWAKTDYIFKLGNPKRN